MSVRLKLLLAFAAASGTLMAFTAGVVRLQLAAVDRGAQLEALNLARSVAYGAALDNRQLQRYVEGLDNLYKRDIVIVDAHKRGIADADIAEIGQVYSHDPGNEVGKTLVDGRPRVFVEPTPEHPEGIEQITVPVYDGRTIVGAVVLEFTNIHAELLRAATGQIYAVAAAGLLCVLLIGLFGMRIAGSISSRLQRLQQAVERVALGHYDTRLPLLHRDEIGALTFAFNSMTDDLNDGRAKLMREMQRERESAQKVKFLALHDRLTGLSNRSGFSRTLELALKDARRCSGRLAILFVDLDRFKNINDTLGHEAGDELLQETALRLESCLRDNDSVARLGGDEFVVMLPDTEGAEHLATMAQKLLAAVSKPVVIQEQEFRVTASIGISIYPDHGEDERTLMKHADIAMYQAKDDGRNGYAFYSAELNQHSVERLAFESALRRALEEQQFQLHYQPKIDCRTGRVAGLEALLRWRYPDLGSMPPAKFIPVAEETGLIVALGRWIMRTACRQQVAWVAQGLPPVHVAVNLSARQFSNEHLLRDVRAILAETGMDPAYLELEITESMLMRNLAKASEVLASFKALGIRLSVDDFGTGYSSLSHLKRLPIDTIKIDRSFIKELPANEDDKAITDAIIAMGKTLGMTVVAEGVETVEQVEFLREHGCDELQGFYFSKAVPAERVAELFRHSLFAKAADELRARPSRPAPLDSAFAMAA